MNHKNIRILRLFNFFTDFRMYAPFAIIYFAKVTGSYALGASIFSIMMVSTALFELPTGIFSDRIGRKKTVIWGAIFAVLYSIFYAIGQSFWILVIGALFHGLSRSFYSGNNDALLYDSLSETKHQEHYAEHMGRVGAMFQLGLAISALLGGFLATWSFTVVMWISVIPQLICLCLAFFLVEPKVHSVKSGNIYDHLFEAWKQFINNKKLRLLSISSILTEQFGEASYAFQSAFYQTLWPLWAIGIAKTLSNVEGTLSFHFSGRILKKFNGIKVLIIDNIYNSLINSIAVLFPTILSPLLMTSTSFFYGVTSVARETFIQKEFTNAQRATMGSLISFVGSIFFGVLSIAMGLASDIFSPARAFLILMVFQLGILWFYRKLNSMR